MSGFHINRIVLDGNLTRDPELRTTSGGTPVCSLRIANNTRRKSSEGEWEDKPNYFSVTVWSGIGEWCASNLDKGDKIVVEGRMEWREWEDQEGNKRQSYDVIAESIVPPSGERRSQSSFDEGPPPDTDDFTPKPQRAGPDDEIPF